MHPEPAPQSSQRKKRTVFAAGDVVAERYRIVSFLASGGGGEVYAADDLALGERLALKAVRPAGGPADVAHDRFKREISLARQVTHPNVCRIYDLGLHQAGPADVFFLTMELLEGETLFERIRRSGQLDVREALPIVRQLASGLEAARRAGVVHRDFKSSNVILVPEPGGDGGIRAVITDFGLARATATSEDDTALTAQNVLVGTPAYMAPEQVGSGPITPATDLYAFGIVLYEMLTGRYPFDGGTPWATAVQRLTDTPSSPRLHRPDLDPRWERAILRCLEREPGKRFPTPLELVAAVDDEPERRRRRHRWQAVTAAIVAAVALAGGLAWLTWVPPSTAPPAVEARRSLAIVGFRDLAGAAESAWLSPALGEMLASEAAAGDRLRVVPGETVARAKLELGLDDSTASDAEALGRLADNIGSDLLVTGTYLLASDGRELRLDLQVRDPRDGRIVARISERGSEATLLDLVETAGRSLRSSLGVGDLTETEAAEVRASLPAGPDAARLYAEGLARLRLSDAKGALDSLEAAALQDPANPLVQTALASAWGSLGYEPRARQAATRAVTLASGLGRRDRLWVEAQAHELDGQREEAIEAYRMLWDYFPDNLEYGLALASAQVGAARGDDAIATVAALRRLPSSADPRVDLAEAEAARALARYEQQRDAAVRAGERAKGLGATLLVARAREVEAGARRDLGEHEKALEAYDEAQRSYAAAGLRGAQARVLIAVAKVLRQQGRLDDARELCRNALTVAREIGDQGSTKHALNTMAVVLRQQGKLREAIAMHELEIAAARETGDLRSVQVAVTSLGVARRQRGDLAGARESFTESLALSREAANPRSIAINLNNLGEVLLRQGKLAEARGYFEEALALNEKTRDPRGRAYYLVALGDVDFAAGEVASARARHEEALAIRRDLGERSNVAMSLLSLGDVALEEGRHDDAASHAREAAEELRTEGQTDGEAFAALLLARSRLAAGRLTEAGEALDRANVLAASSESRELALQLALCRGELAAAKGDAVAATTAAKSVADEATRLGFFELRLAAEILRGRLDRPAGKASLAAVAREADAAGYRLIAARARAAAR